MHSAACTMHSRPTFGESFRLAGTWIFCSRNFFPESTAASSCCSRARMVSILDETPFSAVFSEFFGWMVWPRVGSPLTSLNVKERIRNHSVSSSRESFRCSSEMSLGKGTKAFRQMLQAQKPTQSSSVLYDEEGVVRNSEKLYPTEQHCQMWWIVLKSASPRNTETRESPWKEFLCYVWTEDISTHLSFGSQLNKTVRSLLSRRSFHGMSSSSGLRLMDFILSSKLVDL